MTGKKSSFFLLVLLATSVANFYGFAQTGKPAPKNTSKAKPLKENAAALVVITPSEIEAGKNLLSKSDCLACHQLKAKVVGPAYSAVAEKYPATEININALADKIIKGGAGVWGQVPMPPHPTVKADDAKQMVKYVLSVK